MRNQSCSTFAATSLVLAGCLGFALFPLALAQPVDVSKLPPPAARVVDFVSDIQPILERACLRCHGSAVSLSGFRLDNRVDAMKGGSLGADVVSGQSGQSRMIHLVARLVPELEMPPKGEGEALTREEISLLRAWIDQGVNWPEGLILKPRSLEAEAVASSPTGPDRLPPPASRRVDFVRDIRPILSRKCYTCHGATQQSNQLRWDVKAAAFKGGVSGRAFEPGRSGESLMIRLVSEAEPGRFMPLRGERLTAEEIGLLRAWIDQGAPWPDGLDPEGAAGSLIHWAYRPLQNPALPKVKNRSWSRSPIDRFILKKLSEKGLKPSAPADKATLLRRVSYDLTGLPPAVEELQSFLADTSPEAYPKVVDRLLASPRYGERWARHWLDVVHYADSHGHDQDRPRDNAWPYRDYVIRSLNDDKPYARFVEEQLAGDVLYPDDPAGVVATGFIASGPFDESSMVSIVDDTLDKKKAQTLDRDDMVTTVFSTFQSTTIHCARCHNHKFDPITQTEYYRLQAVFAGIDRADRVFDTDPDLHCRRQSLLRDKLALENRRRAIDRQAMELKSPQLEAIETRIQALQREQEQSGAAETQSKSLGYQSQISPASVKEKWVQLDLGQPVPVEFVVLVPVQYSDSAAFGFPERFRVDLSNDPQFVSYRTLLDRSRGGGVETHPTPWTIPGSGLSGRYVRVTTFPPVGGLDYWFFALAEMLVVSQGENWAAKARVTALDSVENLPQWSKANLADGHASRVKLEWPAGLSDLASVMAAVRVSTRPLQLELEIKKLKEEKRCLASSLLEPTLQSELTQLERKLTDLEASLAKLPPAGLVYAGASDFAPVGNLHPSRGIPRPIHFLKRGEITMPGEEVLPGALSLMPGLEATLTVANLQDEGLRRAALARWITSSQNALTWRSIVNRVWHYHFGRGIVSTPNDFGRMGGLPSHPELLDWLANWFLQNGGSLKKLHRLVVTSQTYQQSSADQPESARTDAENQYFWRMNRLRLDAESVRDSVLQITGKLDLKMGGPPVKQFYFDDPNPGVTPIIDYARFDVDSPESFRRSIYRYVFRTVTDPLMDSLDCPDSSQLAPVRNTSITALQALTMWNNRFVVRQAKHFADRLESVDSDLRGQLETACLLAWSRRPTETEMAGLFSYASRHGMANACRVILNSNAFMFVN
ncbi:MAG: DUF1553 domain-containing protein [Acidobacteriota bacterium]